jgi:hypothetical protein
MKRIPSITATGPPSSTRPHLITTKGKPTRVDSPFLICRLSRSRSRRTSRRRALGSGRKAFLGKDGTTVVIHDPMHPDGGTIFHRNPATLDDYWQGLK